MVTGWQQGVGATLIHHRKRKISRKQTGFGEMVETDVNQSQATGTNCYLHVTRPSISHRRENRHKVGRKLGQQQKMNQVVT